MNNDKKNFFWNMLGSIVNSFTSLFFMIIVTRINGTNIAGIFTFAFSLACLFQVIANYSGRTFQVTNIDNNINDSDFIYNRITSCIFMVIFVILYLLLKDYNYYKVSIIFLFVLYRLLESFTDSMYGVIQKNNELYKVGISLFLKGILGTVVFFILDFIFKNVILSIVGLLIVNFLIVYFYDYKNFKVFYNHKKYNKKINIKLFKIGVFVFGFTFLTQYILNAPKYAIDDYLSNEMQTIYGIISMPATFMVLCSQFIIQPLLVKISDFIKNNNYNDLLKLSLKTILYITLIGLLAIIGAYFLGIQLLELVYGINLNNYLVSLLVIIIGATLFSISYAISSILTAMRKTFIQIIFYIICSLIILFLSRYLVFNYNILGGTLSYLISMFILCNMYLIYYLIIVNKNIKKVVEK